MEKYLVWIIKLSISGLLITPLLVSPQTIFPFVVGKALWFRSLVIIATTAFLVLKIKYKKDKPYISPVIIILIGRSPSQMNLNGIKYRYWIFKLFK